jgi:Uncharacterized conserved domain (SAYSvFN)
MPPAGFKRSRALWQRDDDSMAYYGSSAFRNAVIYELQPLRWNEWTSQQDWVVAALRSLLKSLQTTFRRLPAAARVVWKWLNDRTGRQWLYCSAALFYYAAVRYIHYQLEAGPIVIIITALVAIFTVGLSDSRNDGLPSAYSIFNQGFASLMGSVDADALVRQHVGGGLMGAAMGVMAPPPFEHREPIDQRRRVDQLQRPDRVDDNHQEQNEEGAGQDAHNNDHAGNNVARRPRKKQGKRRSNGEHKREIQRQREAAAAFGFGGADEDMAMNRLVEEQMM